MKGLSLYHPWAMLVAIGAKKWETRSRRTNYRGALAIVAGLRWDDEVQLACTHLPYLTAFERNGIILRDLHDSRGKVVAVCDVVDCISSTDWIRRHCRRGTALEAETKGKLLFTGPEGPRVMPWAIEEEYRFGNYAPNRFAYKLETVRKLKEPYPVRGYQGMWNLTAEQEAEILKLV